MKEVYRLTCLSVPVAQPRQRTAVIKGKAHNYTPTDSPVNQYKSDLQWTARQSGLPLVMLDEPLVLSVNFFLPRPAKYMRKKYPDGAIIHAVKPDWGNLSKSTEDALNNLLWRDDSQICGYVNSFKFYHEKDGRPRVEIVVYSMEDTHVITKAEGWTDSGQGKDAPERHSDHPREPGVHVQTDR